jgi:uncharacterized membrane protein YgdD (TMEM256/DUF423 family)
VRARAATLNLIGTVLFCGSLYARSFGAARVLGVLAPVGGLADRSWLPRLGRGRH